MGRVVEHIVVRVPGFLPVIRQRINGAKPSNTGIVHACLEVVHSCAPFRQPLIARKQEVLRDAGGPLIRIKRQSERIVILGAHDVGFRMIHREVIKVDGMSSVAFIAQIGENEAFSVSLLLDPFSFVYNLY